jgi:outer membrane autotransporter protein
MRTEEICVLAEFPSASRQHANRKQDQGDRPLRLALLATAALGWIAPTLIATPAAAQEIIDDGDDTYLPGDRPDPWTLSGDLHIGHTATASLVIRDGGEASADRLFLGYNPSSTGILMLTGAGSTWNSEYLTIGHQGLGELTVATGSVVTSDFNRIAALTGSEGVATVRGAGARWITRTLMVGAGGTGTLTVEAQGAVASSSGIIGALDTGAGTATVTGNGSLWSTTDLTVGGEGNGTLNVESGGRVTTNSQAIIGLGFDRDGAVTVTGAGSAFENADRLYVGAGGTGTLTVADRGLAQGQYIEIGFTSGGTATVSGNGSSLSATTLGLGYNGTGVLTVESGGRVTTANGVFGAYRGGSGMGTVTGAGSAWNLASNLVIGLEATGRLTIENGGAVTAHQSVLGEAERGVGAVTVTGSGSSWDSGLNLHVGYGGDGSLTVADGGAVTTVYGYLGNLSTGTGDAMVTGADSVWNVGNTLYVGSQGDGVLTIEDGGAVTSDFGSVGAFAGSHGTVRVADADSTWVNSDNLSIGNLGNGTLSIEDGGVVRSRTGYIGYGGVSVGSVILTGGAAWTNTEGLFVGYGGEGTLEILSGSVVSNASGRVGVLSGSTGTATVAGIGSAWNNASDLRIGDGGSGTLSIQDGARVSSLSAAIGFGPDSYGAVAVSGTGSTWANEGVAGLPGSGILNVGDSGMGSLMITDGATVSSVLAQIGIGRNAFGSVRIDGHDSVWSNENGMIVGFDGQGELDILGGGVAVSAFGHIGRWETSTGAATITGLGSTWINRGEIAIGLSGAGALTVSEGGRATASRIYLAMQLAGRGVLNIGAAAGEAAAGAGVIDTPTLVFGTGAGVLNFNHTETDYAFAPVISGRGRIHILAGTTRLAALSNGFTGSTSVSGGTLLVDGALGGVVNVAIGGTLGGTGVIAGSVTVADGHLVGVQGGTLSMGSLTLAAGSSVDVTLGAPNTASLFDVTGNLTLDGTLNVADAGDFGAGVYRLISYGGTLTDNGLAIGAAPAGATVQDFAVQAGSGQVNLISSAGVDLQFWDGGDAALHDNGTVDGGSGIWSAAGRSWTHASGVVNGAIKPTPGFAVFQGTGGVVTVAGGTMGVTGMQFAVDGYKIDGEAIELTGASTLVRVGDGTADATDMTATIASALTGSGALVKTDLGTLILTGANSYGGGTEVRGGVLVGDASSIRGDVINDATLVFDQTADAALDGAVTGNGLAVKRGAGVLTLHGAGTSDWSVQAGGLVADAGAFNGEVNIASSAGFTLTSDMDERYAGALAGAGAFAKAGDGALVLTGDSSAFGGTTEVLAGRLVVDGALGGSVAVATGGSLAGSGSVGAVVVAGGGMLSGVTGRTMTLGSLDLSSGATVAVSLGTPSSDALFAVTGDLVLDGTLEVSNAGEFGAGIYRLFDYGGVLTDNGLEIGRVPSGILLSELAVQTSAAGQVNLISTAGMDLLFWDGGDLRYRNNGAVDGGAGVWNATGTQWTDANGQVNGPYRPNPGFAIFQGIGGVVTAAGGDLGVAGMQFAVDGYHVLGAAIALAGADGRSTIRVGDGTAVGAGFTATIASELTGDSRLVKTDLGTLILSGVNSYTGGVEIRGGTLQISNDTNLGAVSGALVFSGGTLATTASFRSERSVELISDARIDVANGASFELSGSITGTGSLVKQGAGVLQLTGVNAYAGDTLVEAGTLIGDTSSIRGTVGNAGTVIFDQAADGSFAGDIAGVDGSDGAMVKRGIGTLTLGGHSTLDWTVESGRLVSATDRFSGDLMIGAGGVFTFDQDHAGSYAGTIKGAGDLTFAGGGTVRLTGDSSAFTGFGSVSGTLIVDEVFGGRLAILDHGRLQGSGTVGSTTIASGGTIAPGNSIGTLTVDGDLTFAVGSRYEVEVDPSGAASDLIHVTGTATLEGGSVLHIGLDGNYSTKATYTILTAAGGVEGKFGDVTSSFAFLDPILAYTANAVTLSPLRNDIDFCDVALTRNQCAAGAGAQELGSGNSIFDAILPLDGQGAREAFDLLSGEIYASLGSVFLQNSRFPRNAALDRMRLAGAHLEPAPGLRMWMQGLGSWGHIDGSGNARRIDHDSTGFLIGLDAIADEKLQLGVFGGHQRGNADVRAAASEADIDSHHIGLYAGADHGRIGLRAGYAFSWHKAEVSRRISFGDFTDNSRADFDASTAQAFGEIAYRLELGSAQIEPFAQIAHVALESEQTRENGGAAALQIASGRSAVQFSTLGARSEQSFSLGSMEARVGASVGWRHAFGDRLPVGTMRFADSSPFAIAGAPVAGDGMSADFGVSLAFSRTARLDIAYDGDIASEAEIHSGRATLSLAF